MKRVQLIVGFAGLALLSPASAAVSMAQPPAGPPAPRVELWGGLAVAAPGADGIIGASYRPLFQGGTAGSGEGRQTLTLDSGRSFGFEAGIAVFPAAHVGIEFRFERTTPPLTVTSTPHDVAYTYTSMPPPDYVPRQVTVEWSDPWPAATGSLTVSAMSFNLAVRAAAGPRAAVHASGGLTVARVSGFGESLAFTTAWLGGHSVLFSETESLGFGIDPTFSTGFNAGGGLDIWLAPQVALSIDGRWMRASELSPAISLTHVVNPDQLLRPPTLSDVRPLFSFDPVTVHVKRLRLLVGVKFGF